MPVLPRDMVWTAIRTGASARTEVRSEPRFRVGDAVIARNLNPSGHTRLPRYVRGKRGIIQRNHGGFVFADTRAHGLGDHPQYVYNVRFEARELWGPEASPRDSLYIDMWESYIEPLLSR